MQSRACCQEEPNHTHACCSTFGASIPMRAHSWSFSCLQGGRALLLFGRKLGEEESRSGQLVRGVLAAKAGGAQPQHAQRQPQRTTRSSLSGLSRSTCTKAGNQDGWPSMTHLRSRLTCRRLAACRQRQAGAGRQGRSCAVHPASPSPRHRALQLVDDARLVEQQAVRVVVHDLAHQWRGREEEQEAGRRDGRPGSGSGSGRAPCLFSASLSSPAPAS